MKIVREYIFEKFEQDSDPISDMGIGIFRKKNFNSSDEYYEFLYNYAAEAIIGIPLKDVINHDPDARPIISEYFEKLLEYSKKYITVNGSKDEWLIFWAGDVRNFVLNKERKKY